MAEPLTDEEIAALIGGPADQAILGRHVAATLALVPTLRAELKEAEGLLDSALDDWEAESYALRSALTEWQTRCAKREGEAGELRAQVATLREALAGLLPTVVGEERDRL